MHPYQDRHYDNHHDNHNNAGVNRFAEDNQGLRDEPAMTETEPAATQAFTRTNPAPAAYLYQPDLAGQGGLASIRAARPSAKKAIIALSTLEKAKRPWEAGFTGGAGISRLNRLNINSPAAASSNASFFNINSATYSNDKHFVSDVRPDISFMAGIYLQKPLSKRWTLNLGMNLHFYSTQIMVGQPVSAYVPVTVSLIAPTVQPAAQSTPTYTAGDKQLVTNHYYFLELPVAMQFKLNKSRMLPIFLEGGLSLSRLMGSDALFYNSHSGVYYKDGSVLQKTQFNVSSALAVGLPFHGIRIQLGPQVQYGLTPLINNRSMGDQHFLYTGIRVVVIPGKK